MQRKMLNTLGERGRRGSSPLKAFLKSGSRERALHAPFFCACFPPWLLPLKILTSPAEANRGSVPGSVIRYDGTP